MDYIISQTGNQYTQKHAHTFYSNTQRTLTQVAVTLYTEIIKYTLSHGNELLFIVMTSTDSTQYYVVDSQYLLLYYIIIYCNYSKKFESYPVLGNGMKKVILLSGNCLKFSDDVSQSLQRNDLVTPLSN